MTDSQDEILVQFNLAELILSAWRLWERAVGPAL
jgi:hypothetical protein